jgi:hypothetical protein
MKGKGSERKMGERKMKGGRRKEEGERMKG